MLQPCCLQGLLYPPCLQCIGRPCEATELAEGAAVAANNLSIHSKLATLHALDHFCGIARAAKQGRQGAGRRLVVV